MNRFIEECRREWKRLHVPDLVADEMAADLAADLEEAESEGASPEEVLGSGAPDARSFAASWAAERGVIPPPSLRDRLLSRSLVLVATAALIVLAAVGAALVLFASPEESAPADQIALVAPKPVRRTVLINVVPPSSVGASGVEIHKAGSILLVVGIVGIIVTMPVLFRWPRRV